MIIINSSRLKQLQEREDCMLIDVRSPLEFRDNTITGAVNIPLRNITTLLREDKKKTLIFFGGEDAIDISQSIKYANNMGFTKVYSFGNINK